MQSAVFLRCPLCNAVHALEGRRREYSKRELYSFVKTHLRRHDLSEPKTAIRKYEIVADAVEIVVTSEDRRRLPTEEWTERDNTWLPDGVLPGGETSLPTTGSSTESSSS
jgi:hypothetical protein